MHRYSTLLIAIALSTIFNCSVHAQSTWTDSSASWHSWDGGAQSSCNCGQEFGGQQLLGQGFPFESSPAYTESLPYNTFATSAYYPPVVTHYASRTSRSSATAKSNEPKGPARNRNPRAKRHRADFAAITYIPGPFDEAPAANAVAISVEEQPTTGIAANKKRRQPPANAPTPAEPRVVADQVASEPQTAARATSSEVRETYEATASVVEQPAVPTPQPASIPEPSPATYVQDQSDVDTDVTDEQPLDELLGVTDDELAAADIDESAAQEPEVEVLDYSNFESNTNEPEPTTSLAETSSLTNDANADSYEPQVEEVASNVDYADSVEAASDDEVAQVADIQEASSNDGIDSSIADTDSSSQGADTSNEPEFAASQETSSVDSIEESVDATNDALALNESDVVDQQAAATDDVADTGVVDSEATAIDLQTQEEAVEEETGTSLAWWMFAAAPLALVPAAWLALRRKGGGASSRAQHFIAATTSPSEAPSVPGTTFYPKHEAGQPAAAQAPRSTSDTTQHFTPDENPQQAANAQKAKNLYDTLSQAQGAPQPAPGAASQQAQTTGTDTTVPPSTQPQAVDHGSLSQIQGIDDTTTTLLRLIGINNVADLASADPERIQALMNVQGISQEGLSPRHWIEQARGIMQTA